MEFELSAYLVGLLVGVLTAMDAVWVSLFGFLLGFEIQQVGIFFVTAIKRKVAGRTWTVGWFPAGSYVKFRGMDKEPEDAANPADFGQQPKGKRILILLIDKIVYGTIFLLSVYAIFPGELGEGFDMVIGKFAYILQFSSQESLSWYASANLLPFLVAMVSGWVLFASLLPFGGTKTQHLIFDLFGKSNTKLNSVFNTLSMLPALALMVWIVYSMVRYVNIAHEGEIWSIWGSVVAGAMTVSVLGVLIVLVIGKPIRKGGHTQDSGQ